MEYLFVSIMFTLLLVFAIWLGNAFITLEVSSRVCDRLLKNVDEWYISKRGTVREVFSYHDQWLGFKHWFYPFKSPTEK